MQAAGWFNFIVSPYCVAPKFSSSCVSTNIRAFNTKMMIYFQGYTSFIMIIFFFIFSFFGAPAMAANNPLVELSTTEDLVRLAGYGEEKLSTVVVAGTLICDVAYLDRISPGLESHPIPGASVAVWCHDTNRKISKSQWVRGKTDEFGDFLVDLPSHLHAIPNMEKRCRFRIVGVPKKSPCHRAALINTGKGKHTARIKLTSSGNGIRTYSTYGIHLTHNKQYSHPFKGRKTLQHVVIKN